MSTKRYPIILGQTPGVIIPFFSGEKNLRGHYEGKFIVAEDARRKTLVTLIGAEKKLHGSIADQNGMRENPLLGGGRILLVDQKNNRELILCGGSENYGTVPESVAEEIGRQVREVLLTQPNNREIIVRVRNLLNKHLQPQVNARFSELGY